MQESVSALSSGFLAILLLVPSSSLLVAQVHVVPGAAATQTADTGSGLITFDVVSVKRAATATDREAIDSPPDGEGITIRNLTVQSVLAFAYDFHQPELLSGLPEWAKTEKYDLAVKVLDANVAAYRKLSQAQRRLMLQRVLVDRFRLKIHREPKEMPIYALIVAKSGPKMKEAKPGDKYARGSRFADGSLAGAGTLVGLTGQAVQMATLAQTLSRLDLGREVVNRTGLTGRYDFTLRCEPTDAMRPVINGEMQPVSAEDEELPSIFTAVEEQLGLKLEPAKGLVEGLVVDQIERPSED